MPNDSNKRRFNSSRSTAWSVHRALTPLSNSVAIKLGLAQTDENLLPSSSPHSEDPSSFNSDIYLKVMVNCEKLKWLATSILFLEREKFLLKRERDFVLRFMPGCGYKKKIVPGENSAYHLNPDSASRATFLCTKLSFIVCGKKDALRSRFFTAEDKFFSGSIYLEFVVVRVETPRDNGRIRDVSQDVCDKSKFAYSYF